MAAEILGHRIRHWVLSDKYSVGCFFNSYRHMTSGEVSTALRPFYFTVHPDLFGQYPSERAVNENSLQVLSSYIETLQQNRYPRPTTLTFYLRPQGVIQGKGSFKTVRIKLVQKDLKNTVSSILSTCNLPTTYVDKLVTETSPAKSQNWGNQGRSYRFEEDPNIIFQMKYEEAKKNTPTLLGWLGRNSSTAKEKLAACEPVREEIVKLQQSLCDHFKLKAVLWDCGWNITHFRGCLQAFQALAGHHADAMAVLEGRTLVFGNDTGLSLDGHILLNSGEVRHNWLDFIKNVSKDDYVLKSVPAFEKAMSRVLRDIQIVRRKFQPKTMAKQYENNLKRLTTSLSDYQGSKGYPKHWPPSLKEFELVVETEAGPIMVSPTGQFIVPCSCPSFLLVNFISEHMQKARQLLQQYKSHKEVEKQLHAECVRVFGLLALDKDDCITPALMMTCCESLLASKASIAPYLRGSRLSVTNYYSVMTDGQMCIPWNWKSLESQT